MPNGTTMYRVAVHYRGGLHQSDEMIATDDLDEALEEFRALLESPGLVDEVRLVALPVIGG